MRGLGGIYAEGHRLAHARAHTVGQDAVARFEIRNLVEEDAWTLLVMVQHLGDRTDVFLGVGTLDAFQFPEGFHLGEPIT